MTYLTHGRLCQDSYIIDIQYKLYIHDICKTRHTQISYRENKTIKYDKHTCSRISQLHQLLCILKMVYNSIVLPHMNYGCIISGRCLNLGNVKQICKQQKWVPCMMLRCKVRDGSSQDVFKQTKRVPFKDRVSYKRCRMVFKVNI